MARIDPQSLVDRLFALVLAPAIDITVADCGNRRVITHNDTTLLLQRRRADGDGGKWRTVIKVRNTHIRLTEEWVAVAQVLDPAVEWRLTNHDGTPIDPAPSADAPTTTTTEKANDPAT